MSGCVSLSEPLPATTLGSVFLLETCHRSREENSKKEEGVTKPGIVGGIISVWFCWMEDVQKLGIPKTQPGLADDGGW